MSEDEAFKVTDLTLHRHVSAVRAAAILDIDRKMLREKLKQQESDRS